MSVPTDEESFNEIAEQLVVNAVVAFTERAEDRGIEYDLSGVEDFDHALAMAVKGLFMLVLDALGDWQRDDEMLVELDDSDEEEDEEEE